MQLSYTDTIIILMIYEIEKHMDLYLLRGKI